MFAGSPWGACLGTGAWVELRAGPRTQSPGGSFCKLPEEMEERAAFFRALRRGGVRH